MKKLLKIMLLTAVMAAAFAFTAFAANNYKIEDAAWVTEPDEGRIYAAWDRVSHESKDNTSYKIRLFRSNTNNPLTGWVSTSNMKVEFTKEIAATGTGDYFYSVYPTKGGSKMKVTSEIIEVDSEYLKSMREYVNTLDKGSISQKYSSDGPGGSSKKAGWISMPDGSWTYRDADGQIVTSAWKDINGKRYYFSADGRMVTGWQAIDSLWYFFDDQGALLRNAMTPDGYVVNADGVWIKNGEPVRSDLPKNKKADTSTVTILSEVEMKFSEKSYAGEISTVKISNTQGAKAQKVTYSVDPENWVEGEPVTIYVDYEVYNGYSFADSVVFTCKKAAVVGHTGDNINRKVELLYIPKYTLEAPVGIYMDDSNRLHWDAVDKATSYEVRIFYDDVSEKKKTYKTSINLDDYVEHDPLSVELRAIGNEVYILNSGRVTIEDILNPMVNETMKVEGSIKRTDGTCRYIYADGTKAQNKWVKIGDDWYHFNESGNAEKQGWYTDTTGYKYYFDSKNRMVTGPRVIDGTAYVFNDGSDTSRPEGALIQ